MELSQRETIALFEGLMESELRKMRQLYPRCRIEREYGEDGIFYKVGLASAVSPCRWVHP